MEEKLQGKGIVEESFLYIAITAVNEVKILNISHYSSYNPGISHEMRKKSLFQMELNNAAIDMVTFEMIVHVPRLGDTPCLPRARLVFLGQIRSYI